MSESPSRLIRSSDPTQPYLPRRKIPGNEPPVRIFKQDWLENLTFTSLKKFLMFCVSFEVIVLSIAVFYGISLCKFFIYFMTALILWFITEYLLHRFVFHFASEKKEIQRLVYIFHGNHHIQPNHPYRTLMPIIVSLPIGLIIWGGSIYVCGISAGSSFFSGFFAGYIFYDCMHFATHNFRMRSFPLSLWKRHHLLHHYQKEDHNYSISLPWLDILFRSKYKL
ncbi:sterol desaturase family protein [Bombella sp. TMW 2.2543]|uniref:Sterol desaturase family protein n=1 Tax=Bombella pluederhausensis TaxID=2967336 RepID=A0ABT3WJ12_9PROT|nr:sterol desaturase family protein [Bombella pluederhausensis]MCX5617623.1 sterol desaturase family protein [Bombella pluederhausensis]